MWWRPTARVYEPLKAGSIDGTDAIPHDRAIVRAMKAEYFPSQHLKGSSRNTVFVARLSPDTTEESLRQLFSDFGEILNLHLVRDIVTGFSKRYAFIEFKNCIGAQRAFQHGHNMVVDNREILVEMEAERTIPGWVPRRLGGGWGGQKESGQLRFGGRARPFRKPISVKHQEETNRMFQKEGIEDGIPYKNP
ncbi:SNRNP35, partial [Cordylochernes scorpioides]